MLFINYILIYFKNASIQLELTCFTVDQLFGRRIESVKVKTGNSHTTLNLSVSSPTEESAVDLKRSILDGSREDRFEAVAEEIKGFLNMPELKFRLSIYGNEKDG